MNMSTFVVANPRKCIACKSCEIACAVAHLKTTVATAGAVDAPFQPRLCLVQTPLAAMPVQCRQCEDAPCAAICPARAITRRDGAVVVDTDRCFGCKSCMLACPFGAMDMAAAGGEAPDAAAPAKARTVAHKCDLCAGRPGGPACVEACPALAFVVVRPDELQKTVADRRRAAAMPPA
ncbi:4Fe-4S dicluster domain-containing protein [Solidesulfovibrio sp.]|uniref:4Fe-4S dicluster domain-containing protein n=1 Tax=Solidesulfovibrio sp. TaxID=2910990 RepID=UPI00262FEFC9|nr:4Fe-4S dicluster domain-containing protein [Solidesulfovibrio sp.]